MKEDENRRSLPIRGERIRFDSTFSGKYRVLALFLICAALLVAAFAIGGVWYAVEGAAPQDTSDGGIGEAPNTGDISIDGGGPFGDGTAATEPSTGEAPPATPPSMRPGGATPIVGLDLSYAEKGIGYLVNETPYAPDTAALLEKRLPKLSGGTAPTVLIIHTHTSEGYAGCERDYFDGTVGDLTYTRDSTNNVIAVGEALCRTLQEAGIRAIHCTELFDTSGMRGSYVRSGEAVKRYLSEYPTIQLVIDLHRDAVLDAEGNYIKTEASGTEVDTAQVMAVVGTDANGTEHEHWQANLALALQLRRVLNGDGKTLARPVTLRNASYNQEMAPYALLLELGSGANTVEEAIRCAEETGRALAVILSES